MVTLANVSDFAEDIPASRHEARGGGDDFSIFHVIISLVQIFKRGNGFR
jgi:hypothetical protein